MSTKSLMLLGDQKAKVFRKFLNNYGYGDSSFDKSMGIAMKGLVKNKSNKKKVEK